MKLGEVRDVRFSSRVLGLPGIAPGSITLLFQSNGGVHTVIHGLVVEPAADEVLV
jgi:hypothetical protein